MSVFDSQVKHYKEKFHKTVDGIIPDTLMKSARGYGFSEESLKEGLLSNSEEFRKYIYSFSKTLMPGRVSCTTYAAVVASVAKLFGVEYKAYSGFCLPPNYAKRDETMAGYEEKKATTEHPLPATHVYVTIDDKFYEYYDGNTSSIEHIDCVEI